MVASSTGSYYFSSTCSVNSIRCNWAQLLIVLAQFHSDADCLPAAAAAAAAAALGARHMLCGGLRHRVVLLVPV